MGNEFNTVVYVVAIVTSFLSCVGCFVVFAAWVFLKDTRSSGRRLLLYLTTADLLTAVGNLIGASWTWDIAARGRLHMNSSEALYHCHDPGNICIVQSMLSTIGSMSSFFWTMIIAWQVRETLVGDRGVSWMDRPRYHWMLHAAAWGIPVAIVAAAFADGKLGYWQNAPPSGSGEKQSSAAMSRTTINPVVPSNPIVPRNFLQQNSTENLAVFDTGAEKVIIRKASAYSAGSDGFTRDWPNAAMYENNAPLTAGFVDGSTAGWCWIKVCQGDGDQWGWVLFWTLLAGKGWELLAYIVVPAVYCNIKKKIEHTVNRASTSRLDRTVLEAVRKAHRAMTAAPLVFVALRIWGTMRFVVNLVLWVNRQTPKDINVVLDLIFNKIFLILHAVGDSGQGLGNSIIYCVLADRVRDNIYKHVTCWKRKTGLRYSLRISQNDSDECTDTSTNWSNSGSENESETSENAPILRQKYRVYT